MVLVMTNRVASKIWQPPVHPTPLDNVEGPGRLPLGLGVAWDLAPHRGLLPATKLGDKGKSQDMKVVPGRAQCPWLPQPYHHRSHRHPGYRVAHMLRHNSTKELKMLFKCSGPQKDTSVIKCLSHKHLILIPETHEKTSGMKVHTCNHSVGEMQTDESLGLAGW